MTEKRDWVGECNDQNVPVNDFKMAFCDRCYQPECTRSLFGTSKFDKRVSTWQERLFTEVPRMDQKDPRYLPIADSKFKMYDLGRVPSPLQAKTPAKWLDPRDLPEMESEVEEVPVAKNTPQSTAPVLSSEPETAQAAPVVVDHHAEKLVVPATPGGVRNLPHSLLLMNTPTQSKVLPGAPAALPKTDPWAGPTLSDGDNPPAAPVVQKGAKIKFGGGGVE